MTHSPSTRGERITVVRTLSRGWHVFVSVIVGNAAVQGVLASPQVTPEASGAFLLLATASLGAFVSGVTLIVAQARASIESGPKGQELPPAQILPSTPGRLWWTAILALLLVAAGAVMLLLSVLLTLTVACIVLPAVAAGPGVSVCERSLACLSAR